MSWGRCGGCGMESSGIGAHDAHRLHEGKYAWSCLPEWAFPLKGLIEVDGVWGFTPAEQVRANAAARRERFAAMRAKRNHNEEEEL